MRKSNGVILWEGDSLLDGAPIVAIAVGLKSDSTNRKTGAMLQTYILRRDLDPISAVRTGADKSICGDCPHRGKTCYVPLFQGPLGVYRAYRNKRYPMATSAVSIGEGRLVRLGTYGDPAAVPVNVWELLTKLCSGHTGYTHQWRTADSLKALCMASVDTVLEAREAQSKGWRTFRVDTTRVIGAQPSEVLCPASKEAGKKLTCAKCLACGGADGRKGSIYIPAHGGFAVMANLGRFKPRSI